MKIQIKNWLLFGLFTLCLFSGVGHALDPVRDQARVIPAQSLVALGVSVEEGPSSEALFVEVFSPRDISGGKETRFEWFDENNVLVASHVVGLSLEGFVGLRKIRIPKLDFVGEYQLQANVVNTNGNLIATGQAAVSIDSGSERLALSAPLLVREPEGFRLSYDVENYNLSQSVSPRLQGFFIKDGERQYILQRKLEPVDLRARESKEVEFFVQETLPPGEYYLETWVAVSYTHLTLPTIYSV